MVTETQLELESAKALYKIGTVVFLKSGGPLMTVSQWREDDVVMCQWFDEAKLMTDAFDYRQLHQ